MKRHVLFYLISHSNDRFIHVKINKTSLGATHHDLRMFMFVDKLGNSHQQPCLVFLMLPWSPWSAFITTPLSSHACLNRIMSLSTHKEIPSPLSYAGFSLINSCSVITLLIEFCLLLIYRLLPDGFESSTAWYESVKYLEMYRGEP